MFFGPLAACRRTWLKLMVGVSCGLLAGSAGALFARGLAFATAAREQHVAWVWALPVGGFALGWFLERYGQDAIHGTKRVAWAWTDNSRPLPWHMAPVVLLTSIGTHLFGGSAGREGAAVQIGATVADAVAAPFNANLHWRRQCLVAGMAGAFSAVFGTPVAAVLFALEWIEVGLLATDTLLAGIVAAEMGQQIARGWGVSHAAFVPFAPYTWQPMLLGRWLVLAAAVALLSSVFVESLAWVKAEASARFLQRRVRMAIGGALLVTLWLVFGDLYLGLGDTMLSRSLHDATLSPSSFLIKGLFTVVTLGFGFLGGEVTPLFCMGAALGNALSGPLGLPLYMAASIGTFAVFAAAAKTPISLAVMAAEMFGLSALLPALVVHTTACALRGRSPSIYGEARKTVTRAEGDKVAQKRA